MVRSLVRLRPLRDSSYLVLRIQLWRLRSLRPAALSGLDTLRSVAIMFKKILISNRGEIAVRVIRACREMGIATVAVYSEADRGALACPPGGRSIPARPFAPSTQSYLSIEKIIDAAKRSGAEAVHPGYGFLSENASFAQACEQRGVWSSLGLPRNRLR